MGVAGTSVTAWATLAAGRLGRSGRRSAVATAVSRTGAAALAVTAAIGRELSRRGLPEALGAFLRAE